MYTVLDASMLGIPRSLSELAPLCAARGIAGLSTPAAILDDPRAGAEAAAMMRDLGLQWGLMPMTADFYAWDLGDDAFEAALRALEARACAAEKLGVPRGQLVRRHLLPHLLPQFLTGLILQFPHAILHEASVTFLGFGLSSEQPAIGVILSESMQYLTTGRWWLALFPGAALVGVVLLFAGLGEQARRLLDPSSLHQ